MSNCSISQWTRWRAFAWLRRVEARARKPDVVRLSADFLLIMVALLAGRVLTFLSSNGGADIRTLLPVNFWDSQLHQMILLAGISVAIFMTVGLYGPCRRYSPVPKFIMIAVAVGTAFLANGILARGIPALNIGQDTLFWASGAALTLMICTRLWSLVWRDVLAAEAEGATAPGIASVRSHGQEPVLVIGGAGYIGSSLLPKLLQQGRPVRLMDIFLYGRDAIQEWLTHPNLQIIEADFREVDSLVKAMQGASEVIHLGGIVGDPACSVDEDLTIDVNIAATRVVAEVAKGVDVRKLVFASTCSVYGANDRLIDENSELNPVSLYAKTKIASEKLLLSMRDSKFEPIILRFSTVYGISGRTRFDLVVNLLSAKAVIDGIITVLNGDQWRPFVHVDDVTRAIMAFVDNNIKDLEYINPIFNVGGNMENYTIRQVGEVIKRVVPQAELVFFKNDDDRRNYRVNFEKIEKIVGFEPRWTVEEGVRQVIQTIYRLNIRDYTESRFSNVTALSVGLADMLSKPEPNWARRLIATL